MAQIISDHTGSALMFIMKLVTPLSFLLPVGLSEPCASLTPSNASPSLPCIPFQSISSTNPNISDQSPASLCDIPHFSRGFQSIQCQGLAPVSHTWTQLDHPRIENSLIQEHIYKERDQEISNIRLIEHPGSHLTQPEVTADC